MFELYLQWDYVLLRAVAMISSDFNPFILSNMATFRFELDHRPTRNKTYNLYLMVTVGKKRTKKKTGIQLKHIDDFNPSCKGNNWIRANVLDAKALNEQLRLMLVKAQDCLLYTSVRGKPSGCDTCFIYEDRPKVMR